MGIALKPLVKAISVGTSWMIEQSVANGVPGAVHKLDRVTPVDYDAYTTTAGATPSIAVGDPLGLARSRVRDARGVVNLQPFSGDITNSTNYLLTAATAWAAGSYSHIIEMATTNVHYVTTNGGVITTTNGVIYTQYCVVKKGTLPSAPDILQLTFRSAGHGISQYANFNLSTGAITASTGGTAVIYDSTNIPTDLQSSIGLVVGEYFIAFIAAANATAGNSGLTIGFCANNPAATRLPSYMGSTNADFYIRACQIEAAPSPTPYQANTYTVGGPGMHWSQPIAGARPTRGKLPKGGVRNRIVANAYTDPVNGAIAAAGSEKITNGLLVTDATGWTDKSTGTGTAIWSSGGIAISGGTSGVGIIEQSFTVIAGQVHTLIFTNEINSLSALKVGTSSGASDVFSLGVLSAGTSARHYSFTPGASGTVYLQFANSANNTVNLYVVSCRQQALPLALRNNSFPVGPRGLFTVTSVGVTDGIDTYDVRYQIPITGASNATGQMTFASVSSLDALTGQSWSTTAFLAVVGGSLTNINTLALCLVERTSGGTSVLTDLGVNLKSSLTSALTQFSYSVTLSGGATVAKVQPQFRIITIAGSLVDVTFRIGEPQAEIGSMSPTQRTNGPFDITESGVASIPMDYFDGGDLHTLGVPEVSAISDYFADVGHAWADAFVFSTFIKGGTVGPAKAGATASSRTLQTILDAISGKPRTYIRGADTENNTGDLTDGRLHSVIRNWDGAAFQIWIDGNLYSPTVGVAAEEAINITQFARTELSPAQGHTGFGHTDVVAGRSWTDAEVQHIYSFHRTYYGTP